MPFRLLSDVFLVSLFTAVARDLDDDPLERRLSPAEEVVEEEGSAEGERDEVVAEFEDQADVREYVNFILFVVKGKVEELMAEPGTAPQE